MSDSVRLYTSIYQSLKIYLESVADEYLIVFARTILGLVKGKDARFSKIAQEVPNPVQNESIEKQLSRFHKNSNIDYETFYLPFVKHILGELSRKKLCIVIDATALARKCVCQMAGVVFQSRVIPLTWVVYKGVKGHAPSTIHIQLLKQLLEILPRRADVILLGDGEYDNVEMLRWLGRHTDWNYVVRTAKSCFITENDKYIKLEHLGVEKGELTYVRDTCFTKKGFGPVHAVACWDEDCDEPIYLLSSLQDPNEACDWYCLRPLIETLFSDTKSRGFSIEKSGLREPERVSRLLMSVSVAYIWMIYLGCQVQHKRQVKLLDREDRISKSIFQLGVAYLNYILKMSWELTVRFHIPRYMCT